MNKYGYFTYEDYPLDASATIYQDYSVQTLAKGLVYFDRFAPSGYKNFASFEKGEFDFTKPLYGNTGDKLCHASSFVSDENGDVSVSFTPMFTTWASDTYSGSGFSLLTYNDYYELRITVEDEDGTRSENFVRNEDEFYYMPYSGLVSVVFAFKKLKPYHFIKAVGYSFGTVRKLSEEDWTEEPTVETHFSLTGEDLEYDTLELTIRGDKDNFNIIRGERLTHSETREEFFVDTVTYNSDGTINITAYDNTARLEENFNGVFANTGTSTSWATLLLKGGHSDIAVKIDSTINPNQTFSGVLTEMPYREAAQIFLFGNNYRLKRGTSGQYIVFNPNRVLTPSAVFNESNILPSPEIEYGERYKTIKFEKYAYYLDKTEGKVYAYYDSVPSSSKTQILQFEEPFKYNNNDIYYVTGYVDDEPTLSPIRNLSGFTVVDGTSYMYCKVKNETGSSYEIVVKGYPYTESTTTLTDTDDSMPLVFKDDVMEFDGITIFGNFIYAGYMSALRSFLSYYKKITFQSLLNVFTGEKVSVTIGSTTYSGFVTRKVDNMNGVYEYEVMCL